MTPEASAGATSRFSKYESNVSHGFSYVLITYGTSFTSLITFEMISCDLVNQWESTRRVLRVN